MSASHKQYKPQNARKVTLYSLAGAIIIIAGVYALRAFLDHEAVSQTVAAQPKIGSETAPMPQGIPLPGTSEHDLMKNQIATATQIKESPNAPPTAPSAPAIEQTPPPVQEPVAAAESINSQLTPDAAKLVTEADADLQSGKFISARDKLNDAVRMLQGSPAQAAVKTKLQQLSQMWLFSTDIIKGDTLCANYIVRPGDSLTVIGKKFKVPGEFIQQINNISRPESLQVGQKLKIANGPFRAIVSCSAFTIDIYLQNTYVRTYKVGLGQEGMETPKGLWRASVGGKMIKPRWTDPKTGKTFESDSPDYPLGSRWIGLEGIEGSAKGRTGFAIHGTKDPATIGTKSSQGCIRLLNGEVIEVYNMMMPGYSEVRVID